jgi:hypothetical protein
MTPALKSQIVYDLGEWRGLVDVATSRTLNFLKFIFTIQANRCGSRSGLLFAGENFVSKVLTSANHKIIKLNHDLEGIPSVRPNTAAGDRYQLHKSQER